MDKCYIKEQLISSYDIEFENHTVTINEYSPCFTKEDNIVNDIKIKSLLAKVFGNNE